MANPTTTHVIEIETGIGEPAFIPLTLGTELQPISVGKKGMWRLDGPRVLDVHAFVYFDGAALFLQSADEGSAATVDGYKVGKAWTELHAPCKIDIGSTRLRFRSLLPDADGAATEAAPKPPVPGPVASGPSSRRPGADAPTDPSGQAPAAFPKDDRPFRFGEFAAQPDESTRVAPAGGASGGRPGTSTAQRAEDTTAQEVVRARRSGPLPAPMPSTGSAPFPTVGVGPIVSHEPGTKIITGGVPVHAPQMQGSPSAGPPPFASGGYPQNPGYATGAIPAYPQMPVIPSPGGLPHGSLAPGAFGSVTPQGRSPAQAQSPFDKIVAQYMEMSVPRRILVFLLPLAMLLTVWSLVEDEPQAPPKKVAASDAGAGPVLAVSAWPPGVPCPPPGWPPNVPPPCVPNRVTLPTTAPATAAPPPADTAAAAPPALPPKTTGVTRDASPPGGPRTLERQAVDAVAAGDYGRAAAAYEELSRRAPNNRVYAEAGRILRAKLDAGAAP